MDTKQKTVTGGRNAARDLDWFELDTSKSDYGATHGAYVSGCTLLQLPNEHKSVVAVGLCHCGSRENAERMARRYNDRSEKDRFVSRKTLLSWKA